MDSQPQRTPPDATARLIGEGILPLLDAARHAGLHPLPSLRTLLRATAAGRLESLVIAGRRVTSAPAIVRWVALEQLRLEAANG